MYIAYKDGEREQSIVEHLSGTASLSEKFAASFGKDDWGYCCGMLHDIGKYGFRYCQRKKNRNFKKLHFRG